MLSLDISSSYNATHEYSLSTIQLLTHSQEFSPIQQLNSGTSSNMTPQVLFPNSAIKRNIFSQNKGQTEKQLYSSVYSTNKNIKLDSLLVNGGEICQSFQIEEGRQNFMPRFIQQNEVIAEVECSNCKKAQPSRVNHSLNSNQINFQVPKAGKGRLALKQFESKLQDLKLNVNRLQGIVERFQATEQKYDNRKQIIDPQDEEMLLYCMPKDMKQIPTSKTTASASNGNEFQIHAKSAKSENLLITPEKVMPNVSEFQLHKQINKFDIDQMSPITRIVTLVEQTPCKSNTSESSSRMLMKKKFDWKNREKNNTV